MNLRVHVSRGGIVLTVVLSAVLMAPAPASAQAGPPSPVAAGPSARPSPVAVPVEPIDPETLQDELEALARRVAAAWSRGDLGVLADVMAPEGLALHLRGEVHPALGVRQTRAALQDFMKETGDGTARPLRSEILGGQQPRGLVELGWTPGPGSLPASPGYSVFIGLERRPEGWRATEIRILR